MKLKYPITALITALPFAALTILIWQWPNIKNLAKTPSLPTLLGEKLADSIPQNLAPSPTESWKVLKVAMGIQSQFSAAHRIIGLVVEVALD